MIELVWLPLDTWIVAIAVVISMACALPGCFLLLRGQAMLGDAIAHAVLPGIALGYLLFGHSDPGVMIIAAALMGILTAFLVQLVHRVGGVEEGAAMGVVFTSLFALGLVLVRRAADDVHLDAEHVIFGAIELAPARVVDLFGWDIPRGLLVSSIMLLLNLVFVFVLYKELRLTVFDPSFAEVTGRRPGLVHYLLIGSTAATMVVAFEAVGSILVLAMLIVPPAMARLVTNRLMPMILISLVLAGICAALGHLSAITLPQVLGFEDASTSGMIAVVSGFLFLGVFFFAPGNGLVPRQVYHLRRAIRTISEDVLGALYRVRELTGDGKAGVDKAHLAALLGGGIPLFLALMRLHRRRKIRKSGDLYILTDAGEASARRLVRRHRLWESWLVEELGVRPDHVHGTAERLEHLVSENITSSLEKANVGRRLDPHGEEIPDKEGSDDTDQNVT
ncbi:MAG: metal ABC transporter permease [Candidatus Sumerlaeia bacterium]|nr:metal ABC transporter permease [Candidatus Sumerlaeia bacterium]